VHRLLDRHSIGRTLTLRVLREGYLLDIEATVALGRVGLDQGQDS